MAINVSYRMIYPFLQVFASGMGVPLASSRAAADRSLAGRRLGRCWRRSPTAMGAKSGMLFGLGLFCLGVGVVAVWPSFPTFFLALVLANLGNQVFLPSMQAYLGDRVPYERRGRVLALTEMSWSLSFILLVPLAGLLIARLGWSAPFWLLTCFGFAGLAFDCLAGSQ